MRLKSVWISGFKSFQFKDLGAHEQPVLVDNKVTVLIGANDHGKSNVLEAILRLNEDSPIKEEEKNWDIPKGKESRIEWVFTLDQQEKETLQNVAKTADETRTEELKKAEETKKAAEEEAAKLATEQASIAAATGQPAPAPNTSTTTNDAPAPSASKSISYLPVSSDQNELVFYREGIGQQVKILSSPFKTEAINEKIFLDARPRVELFAVPQDANVIDKIKLAELDDPKFEFMKGIFLEAGIWENRQDFFGINEVNTLLIERASEKLTEVMVKKWGQGGTLKWKFKQVGNNGNTIEIDIEDPSVKGRHVHPSQRSSGFRTFFLLSMQIRARTFDTKTKPHIYLFDEPGTYLHPRAQIDLQRSFEVISDDAQICYTTHSLFLISKNHPSRNRVISKTSEGTQIDQKPFINNWKAIRDSLGIVMSNNFLIADKSLLVEGPSDQFYVVNAIRKLKEKEVVDIDFNDFNIVDGGTSENYVAMAKLMADEGRKVYCLTDGDKSGKEILEEVAKVCPMEYNEKKVQGEQLSPETSVEDIFADLNLLKKAILNVANNLVKIKARKLVDGIKLESEIQKITPQKGQTLGLTIDQITATWFVVTPQTQNKSISKLAIALEYDTLAKNEDFNVPSAAEDVIKNLMKNMELVGERAKAPGVMAEVS